MVIRVRKLKNFIYSIIKDNIFFRKLAREVKYFLEKRKYAKYKNKYKTDEKLVLFECFDGNITENQAIELIKRNSRRYAKRQMTWFRRDVDIQWVTKKDLEEVKKIIKKFGV